MGIDMHADGSKFLPLAFCLVGLLAVTPAAGQTVPSKSTGSTAAKNQTPPKMPWGDPDLQGTWSSDDLRGIPVQRAEEFAGRAELSDEEFSKRQATNQEARTRELNRVGAFRNDVGTRTFRQTSLIVEPADGRIPPLTREGAQRTAVITAARRTAPTSWRDRSFYDRCITRGVLGSVLPVIYGNGNMIFQAPGYVSITYEMVHDTRIIPLDGRPHAGGKIRQYLGDARGHWEGNTLVVETTNFLDNTTGIGGNGGGTPTSDALRIIERFTRAAADVLNYEATIDDPKTFTRPWKLFLPLTTQPGYQVLPYECHEGNLALHNILSAARAEDRAADEATKRGLTPPAPSVWQGGVAAPAAPAARAEGAAR
ncbi:MAG: hypothetical protein C5B57_08570 [Blastocatellia bacterium]|nr:MAG: hypothetical protein C5B57_08570 [Blastocatellia bacterium]